jgi:hypothetical protein
MRLIQKNHYNFNIQKVKDKYGQDLVYLNDFPEEKDGETTVWAVFSQENPDRSKGHKNYMMLGQITSDKFAVTGRDNIDSIRFVGGVHCLECDTVIYSANRHDFTVCGCENEASVDGGLDYMRAGAVDTSKMKYVRIDLLLNEVLELKEESEEAQVPETAQDSEPKKEDIDN